MITVKEFVKQTLADIVEATNEFGEAHKGTGASANPRIQIHAETSIADHGWLTSMSEEFGMVVPIDFDLAITAETETSKAGGIGLRVMDFVSAEGKQSKATTSSTVSRVKFRIPLKLGNVAKGADR